VFATTLFHPGMSDDNRFVLAVLLQKTLMVSGWFSSSASLAACRSRRPLIDGLKSLLPSSQSADAEEEELADAPVADALSPRCVARWTYVSKRYRVSNALAAHFCDGSAGRRDLRILIRC
jgi:hypothetical protein